MIKFIKKNISYFKIALIIFLIIFSSGIFLTLTYRNTRIKQLNQNQFNRIKYFESLYRTKRNQSYTNLLISERVLHSFITGNYKFNINFNDTTSVKVLSDYNSELLYFDIPEIEIIGSGITSPVQFFKQFSYLSNTKLSFWVHQDNSYIKAISSEPDDKTVGYYTAGEDFIKEIETGKKITRSEINAFENRLIRYIPYSQNGKIIGFFQLIYIDTFVSSSNINFLDDYGFIFILNNDGLPYFETNLEQKPENFNVIYSKVIRDKGTDKTFTNGDHYIFYAYFPTDALTFGIICNSGIFKKDVINYNYKFWIVTSIAIIINLLLLYFFLRNENRKRHLYLKKLFYIFSPAIKGLENIENEVYEYINGYISDLKRYIKELASSDNKVEFKFLDENDELKRDLISINNELLEKSIYEKARERENDFQNQLNEGSSKIIELLQYTSDLKELSFKIVKNIAEFLKFEQGAVYVLNEKSENEPILEMTASYAFGKQRFSEKTIHVSEGLIGRVFLEKESIYMTDLPVDYNFIESGFGEQQPSSLIIVPLIFNNKVQAIIELASLNDIEDYKLIFIEKIGENIASTIANIKHTLQTEELLEKTRIQSLEIEQQRKTLEEKINTHRMQNRNLDKEILQLIEIIESVKSITYMIEYDIEGVIVDVSSKTMELLNAKKQDLLMLHHSKLIQDSNYVENYKNFWNELLNNKTQSLEETLILNGKTYKLQQNYVPIKNVKRKIYRFLSVGTLIKN